MTRDPALSDPAEIVLSRLGERVRRVREERRLPRRVLSDLSGVSPRYLAQLEGGTGNISIALLYRVARALEIPIAWLLEDDAPHNDDLIRLAGLFRAAPRPVQEQVLDALSPGPTGDRRANRVCLVGLRGAGKSTLGARAGHRMDVPFVELNREIEQASGIPVEEVMALYGPEGYRRLEAQAVDRVIDSHDTVILAVAGGIVSDTVTYDRVLAHFHTIWIRATPAEHMARVLAQGDERPMAGNPAAMDQLRSILESREPMYQMAEAQLDTSGKPFEASLADLMHLIADRNYLGQSEPDRPRDHDI